MRKYLAAYMQIMKDRPYESEDIDAFAGTGYIEVEPKGDPLQQPLFDAFQEPESQRFLEALARIALQIEPPFKKYVFIEKSKRRFAELGEERRPSFPTSRTTSSCTTRRPTVASWNFAGELRLEQDADGPLPGPLRHGSGMADRRSHCSNSGN